MRNLPARSFFSQLFVACLASTAILLNGCSGAFTSSTPVASAAHAITGSVRGGNQVISNSNIYLYAAGTGGYGTAARSMLNGAGYVSTGSAGDFSITSDYTCQPGDQVYLLALGGNPGLPPGSNNAALALMAALGPCSSLQASTFIVMNEVTTVSAAYALAGFMGSATQLSSSGTALAVTGVANAFRSAANLADYTSGSSYATTPAGNGTVPQAEIDSLANILSACVNSSGTTSTCSSLFAAATPPGGSAPTDTIQAILNIAHNPGLNVSTLYLLSPGTAPFQPTLPSAPNDWTVSISYNIIPTTSPYVSTYGISVDGAGNVWVASLRAITELDPAGAFISPSGGYTAGLTGTDFTNALAIDASNNAWIGVVPNNLFNSSRVVKLGPGGSLLSPVGGYTGGGVADFAIGAMAFDPAGELWAAPGSPYSGVAKLSPTGSPLSPSTGFTGGTISQYGSSIISDILGNIWVLNNKYANAGTVTVTSTPCIGVEYETMAIDNAGSLWSPGDSALLKCDGSGNLISSATGYATNLDDVEGISIDGDGRAWYFSEDGPIGVIGNSGAAISPNGGYQSAALQNTGANYFALDGSGNVWVASDGSYVVEFIGMASPVVTPLATGVSTNKLGVRP
jgi:hypothetical protein